MNLQILNSASLQTVVSGSDNYRAVRQVLNEREEITALRRALDHGIVSDLDLATQVDTWLKAIEPGRQFPHEGALAALCVAVEPRRTDWVEQFVRELSSYSGHETGMPRAVGIAQAVKEYRG